MVVGCVLVIPPRVGNGAFTVLLRPLEAPLMFRGLIWDVFWVHKMLGCYQHYMHGGFGDGGGVCADHASGRRDTTPQPHHTPVPLTPLFEVAPSSMFFVCIVSGGSPICPTVFLVFCDQSNDRAQTTFRRSAQCTSKCTVYFAARVAIM